MAPEEAASPSAEYITWQITPERQRFEWLRLHKAIIAARVRIVICGHVLFFVSYYLVENIARASCPNLFSNACASLCVVTTGLFLLECLHIKTRPKSPPRFTVRQSGITEYGEEGPIKHLYWHRTFQLSIESCGEHPAYRSLVFTTEFETPDLITSTKSDWMRLPCQRHFNAWMQKLSRRYVPLPDSDERKIAEAINRALDENGIAWEPRPGGAVFLLQCGEKRARA